MTRRASRATLGFLAGIALIAAAIAAIPLSADAEPDGAHPAAAAADCHAADVALDEGYGLTRTALQRVCARR